MRGLPPSSSLPELYSTSSRPRFGRERGRDFEGLPSKSATTDRTGSAAGVTISVGEGVSRSESAIVAAAGLSGIVNGGWGAKLLQDVVQQS